MRHLAVLAVLALLLAGCGGPDPRQQAATQAQLGAITSRDRTIPAPATFAPLPWQAGQWVLIKDTYPKRNEIAIHRLSVLQADAKGLVLESETQDYYNHSIGKTIYARQPANADEAVDLIQKMITKDDQGQIQEQDFTQPPLSAMKGMMKSILRQAWNQAAAPHDVANAPRADITVPAGTFADAAKVMVTINVGGERQFTTWWHPAVPLSGAVKTVSSDGEVISELLDYGTTGATSRF